MRSAGTAVGCASCNFGPNIKHSNPDQTFITRQAKVCCADEAPFRCGCANGRYRKSEVVKNGGFWEVDIDPKYEHQRQCYILQKTDMLYSKITRNCH